MTPEEFFNNKRVLVVILGIYGGGAQTAKWLFHHGAKVTITDMRTEEELENAMKLFTPEEKKGIRFVLGGQNEEDFATHDIIVLGPGVPEDSPFLAVALKAGKQIENDASLFFRFVKNPVIAVTGTRGKSTTTTWIANLLGQKHGAFVPTGNNPEHPFFKELSEIKDEKRPVVAEMSSWQLEYLPNSEKVPKVAVITNLFADHLNRYKDGITGYALAKANIFKDQTNDDFLILNAENEWTPFYLKQKPKAQIYYFSLKPFVKGKLSSSKSSGVAMNGMFVKSGAMIFRKDGKERKILDIKKFAEKMGEHNLQNLLATVLAVTLFDESFKVTPKMIAELPQIRFRQEAVSRGIVNDSAGTSPDATIMALRRFKKCVLITGGTDKQLEFSGLAKEIKKTLAPEDVIFLGGSATQKLISELGKLKFFKKKEILLFETLEECVEVGLLAAKKKKRTLVFSPGSASFEKFKNEFDRGEKFNALVKK